MAYVICSPCIDEKAAECVDVCPVDCIHEGEDQFFIDPDTCIECGACVTACPVEAIYHEEEVPDSEVAFIEKNAQFYK